MKCPSIVKMVFSFLVLYLFADNIFAQNEIEFNEIKGSIEKDDKYQKDLGRYDGYEVPLYEGEKVNFIVYAEKFNPKIVLVKPSGTVFKQSFNSTGNVASVFTSIDESGNWILYVVADSSSYGDYTFQYAFASQNLLELPQDSDFYTSLNFITAHAKAYFLLMENVKDKNGLLPKLSGALDVFVDENNGNYNAKMFEGNILIEAEKLFSEYSAKISKCLGNAWNKKSGTWSNVEDYKVKSTSFVERVKEKERIVVVSLKDVSKSRQKFTGNYVLSITVLKNN